ncbi:MAG: HPr family phosphocarrier protein [Candidatus Coatesbacteria bacterium]
MPARDVEIVNKLGLHLRAAAAFVQLAEKYQCRITVAKDNHRANGKSILSVLALGTPKGEKVRIETDGKGAEEALAALVAFVEGRFGEPE